MSDQVVSRRKNAVIIEVSGRIDNTSADQLGQVLTSLLDAGDARLVLDLAAVGYMNSAGLRVLVAAFKRAQHMAGDLRLAQPSEPVYEVLEMAGFRAIFRMYHSLDDAVNSYERP